MKDDNRISAKASDQLLSECFREYRLKLYRYCLARLDGAREDADDCVQDAFLTLQKTLAAGETVAHPQAFLYRTAENFVKRRKEANAKAALRTVPQDDAAELAVQIDPDYLNAVAETDYDRLAVQLIETLSEDEKTLYRLRYREKKAVEEIAALLGVTPAAASMRLLRLRDKVKRKVYEKGGGLP